MRNTLDFYAKSEENLKRSKKVIKWYIKLYEYVIDYLTNINIENIDYEELRNVFAICSELMISEVLENIGKINIYEVDAYEHLHNLIINLLSANVSGDCLGNLLIQKAFQDGDYLTVPELDFDVYKKYRKLGLERIPKFANALMYPDSGGYAALYSLDIQINVHTAYYIEKMNFTKDEIRSLNSRILKVIRHEMAHIKQNLYQDYIYGIDYNDSMELLQILKEEKLYDSLHDFLPSEYSADILAFKELITDLKNDYNNIFSCELIFEIEECLLDKQQKYPENPFRKMEDILRKKLKKGEISIDRFNIVMDKIFEVDNNYSQKKLVRKDV